MSASNGESTPEPGSTSAGQRLRAARESIEVTTVEVAEALNLPVDVIDAIERDAHDVLPAAVFTRGYIRSYARLLDIDVEPVVDAYQPPEAEQSASLLMDEPSALRLHRNTGPVIGGAVTLAIVVILVVLTVVWPSSEDTTDPGMLASSSQPNGEGEQGVVAGGGAATPSTTTAQQLPARSDAESASPARLPAMPNTTTRPVAPPPQASAAAEQPMNAASIPAVVSATETSTARELDVAEVTPGAAGPASAKDLLTPARARRLTPAGDDRLVLSFSEECWVEISNRDGANLYSDLNRAGRELRLVGQGPFRVLLGYAPGAALSFNGESVPLAPHTRNNVATLMVGQ